MHGVGHKRQRSDHRAVDELDEEVGSGEEEHGEEAHSVLVLVPAHTTASVSATDVNVVVTNHLDLALVLWSS